MGVYISYTPRLPSEYQEVEYIESSGATQTTGQYIKTGYSLLNNNGQIKIKYAPTTLGANYYAYRASGSYYNSSRSINIYGCYSSFYIGLGSNDIDTGYTMTSGNIYEVDLTANNGNYTLVYNGNVKTGTYSGSIANNRSIALFCSHEASNTPGLEYNYMSNIKLYYYKLYDNGVLVRDFVPCYRKSDGVIGLYDLVNSVFYTNSGSGTFSKGNDVTMVEMKNAYIGEVWTPGSNTLLYRPLTANANDESGNGYNGTGRNVTYSSTNGAYISGTATGIDFPSSFSPGTSFTYSIWTKRLPSEWDLLITNWIASYRYIYFRIKNTGEMTLFYGNGSTSQSEWNSITTVSDSVWHNIVLIKDGTNGTIYVDGVSQGTHTFSYNPSPQKVSGGQFCIGQASVETSSTSGAYYKDCIFESSLWTATEVLNYYNQTKSNYGL